MMAKVRRRSISEVSGERLWPRLGFAPGARTGMFMPGVFTDSAPQFKADAPRLQPECGVEAEFEAGLVDGKLAVVLGDVVDARRAARKRKQRRMGRGAGRERPRSAGLVEPGAGAIEPAIAQH